MWHSLCCGTRYACTLQVLICAINRARPSQHDAAQHIKSYLIDIPQNISQQRYTAIAQATLICDRRNEIFHLQKGLSDTSLCRTLSSVVNAGSYQGDSLDAVSDSLEAQLRKDRVTGLPALLSVLQHYHSRTEQANVALRILNYLKDEGVIAEIGVSDDERLQNCAQACARLCYSSGFELPRNLSDPALPDLTLKLAIMRVGRAYPADGQKYALS